jgi:hypothetical protein
MENMFYFIDNGIHKSSVEDYRQSKLIEELLFQKLM